MLVISKLRTPDMLHHAELTVAPNLVGRRTTLLRPADVDMLAAKAGKSRHLGRS